MKEYTPLHVHSHYSLLDGLSKPEDIVKRVESLEIGGCALTDHGNVSGAIKFIEKMKAADLKPIIGCELYICSQPSSVQTVENRKLAHLVVLAKNDQGWKDLVKIVSRSNHRESYYHKPRLSLNELAELCTGGNLVAFSGHLGSHISNAFFDQEMRLTSDNNKAVKVAEQLQGIFGKGNFFLEVQQMDQEHSETQLLVANRVREVSAKTGIPCVATQDAHYARKEDAIDQRILLCKNMKMSMAQAGKPEFGMSSFFRSTNFHIPSIEEMKQWHSEEELANTNVIRDMVEDYTQILSPPILPPFDCPNGMDPDEYLRQLCREGWRKKIQNKVDKSKHSEYAERVKHELGVLQGAGLSSYFLIVEDILRYVKSQGWLVGPGRGSAAGCLTSYLIGITGIDPMPYGLLFERFYNAGRNTEEHISMPDIDMDIPANVRDYVMDYIRNKYGQDKVGQMVTFQTMKGRAALKEVFRAWGGVSDAEMNMITKGIIDEHKINDELEQMRKDTGESSIIRWCLENTPQKLKEWCYIEDDKLQGPLADRFAQAMRLEGTKSAVSRHPAGVVIMPCPIEDVCPMILDSKTGKLVVALEMDDTEKAGGIKFDVLGLSLLTKLMSVQQELEFGEISEIQPPKIEAVV